MNRGARGGPGSTLPVGGTRPAPRLVPTSPRDAEPPDTKKPTASRAAVGTERSSEGRAGMPSGAKVPRGIPPLLLGERMSEPRPQRAPAAAGVDSPPRSGAKRGFQLRASRRFRERAIEIFLFLNGSVAVLIIGLIFVFLFREGLAAFRDVLPRPLAPIDHLAIAT